MHHHVGIHEDQHVANRVARRCIRARPPADVVPAAHDTYPLMHRPVQRVDTSVTGAIIGHDDLVVGPNRHEEGIDATSQRRGSIEDRHDHGETNAGPLLLISRRRLTHRDQPSESSEG